MARKPRKRRALLDSGASVTALDIGPVQNLDDAMWARKRMRYQLIEAITGRPARLPPSAGRTHPPC